MSWQIFSWGINVLGGFVVSFLYLNRLIFGAPRKHDVPKFCLSVMATAISLFVLLRLMGLEGWK